MRTGSKKSLIKCQTTIGWGNRSSTVTSLISELLRDYDHCIASLKEYFIFVYAKLFHDSPAAMCLHLNLIISCLLK